jgi:LCP family protein required for cell wall assembly
LFALIAGAVVIVVLAGVAVVVVDLVSLNAGIRRSAISMPAGNTHVPTGQSSAPGVPQDTGEVNILVMGLDSRVDENGKPYPQDIYNAIHAEDASVGGYNTNVLLYIHIPAGGGPAVGISIPRDDYVQYYGAPGGVSHGKIKEAYGRELSAKLPVFLRQGLPKDQAYQQARDAAREEEIQTVSTFLGGVRIDHFVEVTMAAFYRVAQAVQPITVCLNHATADPKYSGANFPAGMQQLNASQAMSFVRQRRDTVYRGVFLTDLDRTRRQQAFMVSLAVKLRNAATFTNFDTLQTLIDTAKQYIALDQGLDLLSLASDMQHLSGGGISFQTLPVESFGTIDGQSVNIVSVPRIQAIVAGLLHPVTPTVVPTPTPTSTTEAGAGPGSPAPAQSPTPAQTSYTNSQQPMQSGAIPCVN